MSSNNRKINILVCGNGFVNDEMAFLSCELEKSDVHQLFLVEPYGSIVPNHKFKISQKNQPRNLFIGIFILLKIIIFQKPDLIEQYLFTVNSFRNLIYSFIFNLFRKKRIVHCIGGEILYWKSHSFLTKLSVGYSLRTASSYICKEPYMKQIIEQYQIAPLKNFNFIENAIEPDFYEKAQLKLLKNPVQKVVLFFNSFKPWRNVEILISAAHEVLKSYSDVLFLIVGARESGEYNRYVNLIKDKRIQLLYNSNNKEFFFSITDIFCLPADHVYLNVSLLEAMSYKIPCIVSEAPDVHKIIKNNIDGLIVPNKDYVSLANTILYLLKNPLEAENIGKKGYETITSSYHVSIRAKKHLSVIQKILFNQ